MFTHRPAADRGHANHGWLDTFHTFSFADYHDPAHDGFRSLRVINEDRIAAGQGFGTHGHRDMEILTWVLAGELEHRDSLGSGAVLRPGDSQVMSAGRGIRHSEWNPSESTPLHLLQIWLLPLTTGITPRWEQRHIPAADRNDQLCPIASRAGQAGGLAIHSDATVFAATLGQDQAITHVLTKDRHAWIQVSRGAVTAGGLQLLAGDGVAVSGESAFTCTATTAGSEILVFDLG